jgi:hypothetical protein
MHQRLIPLCLVCIVILGCQKSEVRKHDTSEREQLESKYAAWASRQPRPPVEIVNRIERVLEKEPCVGRLDRWARFYAYNEDTPTKTLYPKIVDFQLEEAGKFGVQPGRRITEPNSWVTIDDRPLMIVSGDFDLSENRIRIAFCGNNVGPAKAEIDRMRAYWKELDRRRALQAERQSSR